MIDFRLREEEIDVIECPFQQKAKPLVSGKGAVGDARVDDRNLAPAPFRDVEQIRPELRFCERQHCRLNGS